MKDECGVLYFTGCFLASLAVPYLGHYLATPSKPIIYQPVLQVLRKLNQNAEWINYTTNSCYNKLKTFVFCFLE